MKLWIDFIVLWRHVRNFLWDLICLGDLSPFGINFINVPAPGSWQLRTCLLLYVTERILWYTVHTFLILTVHVCSIEFSIVYISSDYYMLSADTWQQAMTGRIDFKTVFMPFCSWVSRRGRKFYNIINNCTGRHSTACVEDSLTNILGTKIQGIFRGSKGKIMKSYAFVFILGVGFICWLIVT